VRSKFGIVAHLHQSTVGHGQHKETPAVGVAVGVFFNGQTGYGAIDAPASIFGEEAQKISQPTNAFQ
jgi:hypothetical protein